MQFEEAARIVAEVPPPHIPASRGQLLYEHIRKNRPENLLELGTARGGSAVFLASALEANQAGHLTTVDSTRWIWKDPTPQEVLDRAGLSHRVTFDKRFSTYSWFLKTEIERQLAGDGTVRPEYDFIFLDGAKNWGTDGIAVVTAEKLLKPGGWLLLDDLGWNYGEHAGDSAFHYEIEVAKLSDSERTEPHLRRIFDLLIRTNPAFDEFVIQDNWWGWAHKSTAAGPSDGGALCGQVNAKTSGNSSLRRYAGKAGRGLRDPRRVAARLAGRR
jgi:predicted O-methyltransferase YrrM